VELTEFGFLEKLWAEKRRVLGSVVVVKKLAQRRSCSHFFFQPLLLDIVKRSVFIHWPLEGNHFAPELE
jgi:hypothetical protein